MTLIVGLSAIVFFIAGYYMMNRIDEFLENSVENLTESLCYGYTENKKYKEGIILIYGKNNLTELVEAYCNSRKYIYESIEEVSHINTEKKYICLLALSYNDVDNLTISSIGFKVYSIANIFSLCNTKSNLKIYKEFNVNDVLLYDSGIDNIFNNIKGLVENAVKNQNKI